MVNSPPLAIGDSQAAVQLIKKWIKFENYFQEAELLESLDEVEYFIMTGFKLEMVDQEMNAVFPIKLISNQNRRAYSLNGQVEDTLIFDENDYIQMEKRLIMFRNDPKSGHRLNLRQTRKWFVFLLMRSMMNLLQVNQFPKNLFNETISFPLLQGIQALAMLSEIFYIFDFHYRNN